MSLPAPISRRAFSLRFWQQHWWIPLALVTLLGAILRLVALHHIPTGLHYDEAVYGLQALDIYHGQFPVYFSSYTGREPLYMYLIALVFRVVGIGGYGVRLTSALIGIATIPLVFVLMQDLANRRVGLLAAALTAFSFWHLLVSRNGYPNILIPPIECASMYCLWRGYRDGRAGWIALGGAFLGLVLYTYLAARFFPITVALFFIYAMLVDWRRFRSRFWGVALAAGVTVLVFAPLGLYFLQHPQDFFERASQVLVFEQARPSEVGWTMLRNLGQSLLGLFWNGDPRWHFNLAGKPVLTLVGAPLLVMGLGRALRRWREPQLVLLPIWMLGMMLPALLTQDLMPQGQRMFGIIPALYGLVALGLDMLLALVERYTARIHTARVAWLPPLLLVGVLAFEGISTSVAYFGVWARRPETFYAFHGDYARMAERVVDEMQAGHTPVIVSREYKNPGMMLTDMRVLEATWVSGSRTLAFPQRPSQEARFLWPAASLDMDGAIADIMAELIEPIELVNGPNGEPAFHVGRLRQGVAQREQEQPAVASFAGEIEVLDWRVPDRARRDKPLRLTVHWRVRQPGQGRVLSVHLVDENGVRWSQSREMGYFPEHWQPGDTVYQTFQIELPVGIPAGRYEARLLLAREDDRLLPVIQGGELAGVTLSLGYVTFKADGAHVAPLAKAATPFGPALRAIGHEQLDFTGVLGGQAQVEVIWQAATEPTQDYKITLELVDVQGMVSSAQTMPLGYQHPTQQWVAGEIVRAIYPISLRGLAPGEYTVRLRADAFPQAPALSLGRIRVAGEERLFSLPPIAHAVTATLAQEIELLGYDLGDAPVRPGQELTLKLYWRAVVAPAGDYKVFVHLVAPDGGMAAQSDAVPAGWMRPTLGWESGEIVVDTHPLALAIQAAEGTYALYVGMYDAVTLQRLPITQHGQALPDARLLLTEIIVRP